MKRRKFLTIASASSASLLLSSFDKVVAPLNKLPATKGYAVKIMATDWGFIGSRDAFCAAVKKEGYDGVEVWWPTDEKGQQELLNAITKHGLQVGFLCGGWQADYKEHLDTFKKVTTAAATHSQLKPLYINCHSGRDYYSLEENTPFIEHTIKLNKSSGVPVYHETHRGRILFAAHITKQYLEKFKDLQLTLDISHWCNVHESLLGDQQATVAAALKKTGHVHARVGHAEGPQVNDPRAPEWAAAVQQHIDWWDTIAAQKRAAGEVMTILTEFGPPDYLPALPYTRQPVANQWEINAHMMDMLRKRYQ